ncbi:MAG: hypothetical protein IPH44_21735 [Myxococcales bacterium]|nr:hypothetical protein [Myxococcales bacterium]MBK7191981.1 hypothetical protein [Myxococcales bacterium]MBP6842182.1 hypothetical protein [Kofleriaceae bacterium]
MAPVADPPLDNMRAVYHWLYGERDPVAELRRADAYAVLAAAVSELEPLRTWGPVAPYVLSDAYAVHRVDAWLRLGFQQPLRDDEPIDVTVDAYVELWRGLGLSVIAPPTFHPFFVEIVDVEAAEDPGAAPTLIELVWPCLMWGRMLFTRAGARVRAGADVIDRQVACTSTMYWAHVRRDRPCQDLSTGWGSNSQWGTDFRRDYVDGDLLRYNVDAKPDRFAPKARDDELLRHRCSVRAPALDDAFPYYSTAVEPAPAALRDLLPP